MGTKQNLRRPPPIAVPCVVIIAFCVFLGVVVSFYSGQEVFGGAKGLISKISFDEVTFKNSIKKALLADFVYCVSVAVFSSGFPISLLPGVAILAKGFMLGIVAGLSAKYCVFSKAAGMFFSVFISNVIVLPLYVLLFVASLKYSLGTLDGPNTLSKSAAEYFKFLFKVCIFYGLLCIAQCIQVGIGVIGLRLFCLK